MYIYVSCFEAQDDRVRFKNTLRSIIDNVASEDTFTLLLE